MFLFFKSWCENIIIGVIILVIVEMICPDRFVKYVKIIASIFLLYLIISPIINNISVFTSGSFLKDIKVQSDKLISESKKYDIEDYKSNFFESKLNETKSNNNLNQIFIEGIKINVKQRLLMEGYEVNSINLILDENNENIKCVEVNLKNKYVEMKENNVTKIDEIKEIINEEIIIDKNLIIIK